MHEGTSEKKPKGRWWRKANILKREEDKPFQVRPFYMAVV